MRCAIIRYFKNRTGILRYTVPVLPALQLPDEHGDRCTNYIANTRLKCQLCSLMSQTDSVNLISQQHVSWSHSIIYVEPLGNGEKRAVIQLYCIPFLSHFIPFIFCKQCWFNSCVPKQHTNIERPVYDFQLKANHRIAESSRLEEPSKIT